MHNKDIMLIVDDLDINRDVLKEMFKDEFHIIEAEDGNECIEMVNKYGKQIEIILLDIQMPLMSGIEVLKYRNSDIVFSSIPVIVITVNDEINNQMMAFQLGATDYITKPFIREIVIYRINNVLSSKKRLDEILKEKESFQVKSELDLMTGLYNKFTVEKLISALMKNNDKLNALLVIDIDNFKFVNDYQGHQVGDHTIRIIADLISGHFRKTDIIGRIGGDEFVVFMVDLPSEDLARRKTDELAKLLRYKPNITLPANVSVSIGMSFTNRESCKYEEIFSKADEALYAAKKNGKGQYAEYGLNLKKTSLEPSHGVALLFSRNRDICGVVNMIIENIMLIEILFPGDILCVSKKYANDIRLLYIDISAESDDGEALLNQIKDIEWLKNVPIFAVCKEGNMKQYANALKANSTDIIPAPIDITFAKRRTFSFFKNEKMKSRGL